MPKIVMKPDRIKETEDTIIECSDMGKDESDTEG